MTVRSPFLAIPLILLLLYTAAGMIAALFWALWQVIRGRPLFPPWPESPRVVPWGGLMVGAVVVAWFVVNLTVFSVYVQFRAAGHIQTASEPVPTPPAPGTLLKATPDRPGPSATVMSFGDQIAVGSLSNLLLLLLVPAGLRLATGAGRQDLGLCVEPFWRNVKLGVLAFLVVTPLVMAVNALAQLVWKPNRHPLERMLREGANPGVILFAYVTAVVLAPAAEELIFRGILQAWLRRVFCQKTGRGVDMPEPREPLPVPAETGRAGWRWLPRFPLKFPAKNADPANPYTAPHREMHGADSATVRSSGGPALRKLLPVLMTSGFFAAVHFQQMPAPLAIFPLSLALGMLYETTGSLLPSFVLHALFNGFNTTLLLGYLLLNPTVKL